MKINQKIQKIKKKMMKKKILTRKIKKKKMINPKFFQLVIKIKHMKLKMIKKVQIQNDYLYIYIFFTIFQIKFQKILEEKS